MTALPTDSPTDDLNSLAQSLSDHFLTLQPIHRVRGLEATANCQSIILSGDCDRYYYKQVAQEIAKKFLGKRATITNQITVRKEISLPPES